MHPSRAAVIISWLFSAAAVGTALFSGSYMQRILRGEAVESRSGTIAAFVAFSLVCGLPWLLAYSLQESSENFKFRVLFSVIAAILALFFSIQIANGHDFAIGLNVIFLVLSVWVAYPSLRWLCRN